MKVRTGFVSNSSSSSFIIALPHMPKDAADLQSMIFGNGDRDHINPYGDYYSAEAVAEVIYRELWQSSEPTFENLLQECASMGNFDSPYMYGNDDKYDQLPWEERDRLSRNWALGYLRKFLADHPSDTIRILEFGDEGGGINAAIESGDAFSNIPHVHISHH